MTPKELKLHKQDVKFLSAFLSSKWQKGRLEHKGKEDDLSKLSPADKVYQIMEEAADQLWYAFDLYKDLNR